MALSPQDKEFYEERLSMKSFGYVAGATICVGTFGFPFLFFVQDWSRGLAGRWTLNVAFDWCALGFLIGSVVAVFMYLFFKFLLEMGWLPARR
jgi:uncharacterized PurR-regulated membrane protein YhhQ (DUF165 family)